MRTLSTVMEPTLRSASAEKGKLLNNATSMTNVPAGWWPMWPVPENGVFYNRRFLALAAAGA